MGIDSSNTVHIGFTVIAGTGDNAKDIFYAEGSGPVGSPTTWYLAEGCTNYGFETWVLVQNPNDEEASVTLTYMTTSGE